MLKTVLSMYNEEVSLPRDYGKVLNLRQDASQHIYLTKDEIQRIIYYEPTRLCERVVKNQFLMGCLTGARHSDYIRFTRSNIQGDSLFYVSIKTHIKASIPISPAVLAIMDENEKMGYNEISYSSVYFNRTIKDVCKKVGINDPVSVYCFGKFLDSEKWKLVTSHTARRSFATNLYLAGVDIYTISRLCGHSSVEMTKQYICCAPVLGDKVRDFLGGFK
jgi:integrase